LDGRDDLIAAVEETLAAWERWRQAHTLLTEWPPAHHVVEPLSRAIKNLAAFKAVQGRSLFSGRSGVVIFVDRIA
jgi:hypothetical protein